MISFPHHSQGIALIAVMIVLTMVTLLAFTEAGDALLHEKLAANTHDRELALRAAEGAITAAEERLMGIDDPTFFLSTATSTVAGLHDATTPPYTTWREALAQNAVTSSALPQTAAAAQHLSTLIGPTEIEGYDSDIFPHFAQHQITAQGYGARKESRWTLQAEFISIY